jgi:hypothetical protein
MRLRIYIFIALIIIIIIHVIQYFVFYTDITGDPQKYNLREHGLCIHKNVLTDQEIAKLVKCCDKDDYKTVKTALLRHPNIRKCMNHSTNPGYVFQDYIWVIKKSSVHTCHRDNNGDFFNKGQKHPSYTVLVYLEDMDKCLGVIPTSHHNLNSYNVNMSDPVINMVCGKGDVIIFNANLIHVGTLNTDKEDNLRIQLKLTHKDDLDKIEYYQNFNKILNDDNTVPLYMRKAQKRLTCMFPGLANLTQSENIRTARGSSDGIDIGLSQRAFSYIFYGNDKFYDLPNAFN